MNLLSDSPALLAFLVIFALNFSETLISIRGSCDGIGCCEGTFKVQERADTVKNKVTVLGLTESILTYQKGFILR